MRFKRALTITAVSAFALAGIAACSDDKTTSSPSTSSTQAATQFGAGCAAVPTDASNPGSFDAMSQVPVATAASGNPLLSTLVTAVKQADLVDALNSAPALTVFAPTNDAFAKIPADTLKKVLADKPTLTKILTHHVIPMKLSPDKLAGSYTTLAGDKVTITGSGDKFTVDGVAMVICGNVQTANGTVYIIDSVLMPS